jgi:hypothetical protein
MDTHDTAAANAGVSVHGEQPPRAQSQPAATSESEPVATDGVTSNGDVSAYDQNLRVALTDAFSSGPLLGNNFMPEPQASAFTAADDVVPGNGLLPLGVTMPFNPILPGLDVSHPLQPTNDHAMSAGTATYKSTRNSPAL